MGTYYNISNQTKKQWVDPGKVGEGSIKQGMCINCGTLLAWLMMRDWQGDLVTINPDTSDFHYDIEETYVDVTLESIKKFNEVWPMHAVEVYKNG